MAIITNILEVSWGREVTYTFGTKIIERFKLKEREKK